MNRTRTVRGAWAAGALALGGMMLTAGAAAAQNDAAPTYAKDVAPIFRAKCENCHRPGYIAPMSLQTYAESRPWARSIRNRVETRQMPPWHIDKSVGIQDFQNDRSLTDAEIDTIVRWVDGGAPRGNPEDMPPPAEFADDDLWNFASETPVTDGERLYVLFGNVGLYALALDGTPLWSRDLPPARTRNGWGTASSPALHDGRLYLVVDNEEQSHLLALSAETGAEQWRADRDEGTNWSTPYVWEHDGRTEIVTAGTDRVRSYDLAGRELWSLAGMSSIVVPTPVAAHGLLYLESGYIGDFFRPVYAIRPGASGDISLADGERAGEYVAWSLEQGGSYHPSPLVYGGRYYTLLDRGMMTAHDARTGAEVYGRRRIAVGEAFTASPWAYNGKVFALSEQGTTYVIEAGPEFRVVARNPLDEFTMATPAVLDDSLIIRTAEAVWRIAER